MSSAAALHTPSIDLLRYCVSFLRFLKSRWIQRPKWITSMEWSGTSNLFIKWQWRSYLSKRSLKRDSTLATQVHGKPETQSTAVNVRCRLVLTHSMFLPIDGWISLVLLLILHGAARSCKLPSLAPFHYHVEREKTHLKTAECCLWLMSMAGMELGPSAQQVSALFLTPLPLS